MDNTTLKQQIDTAITNKTAMKSITPANVGENIKATVDYVDQEIANIALIPGPAGADGLNGLVGPAGPQGVAGPVGPAGLNWQGVWVSGTSYVEDDAVGYNGASWFCINATSGTTTPNLDVSNWALLASQGSPGPQGVSGGSFPQTFETLTSNTNSGPFPFSDAGVVLFDSSGTTYALPANPLVGEIKYIRTLFSCTLYASPNPGIDGANNNFITPTGNGNSSINLLANKVYRVTYLGRFGGTWGYWNIEAINNLI